MLAYFRLVINHYDEEALRRVINYPQRGIGATTVERLIVAANQNKVRIWDIVSNPQQYNLQVNKPTQERLQNFAIKIKSFSTQLTPWMLMS